LLHVDVDAEFQQLLCQDDQLILIKSGFFEVWMIRMARMFDTSHMTLLFTDGSIVPRTELDVIFSVCNCSQHNSTVAVLLSICSEVTLCQHDTVAVLLSIRSEVTWCQHDTWCWRWAVNKAVHQQAH